MNKIVLNPSDLDKGIPNLLDYGFITGSQAFGVATENSDWDIVIPMTSKVIVEDIITPYFPEEGKYFISHKFTVPSASDLSFETGFMVINIIYVHPVEFIAWYLATKSLRDTLKGFSKRQRVSIFQTLMIQFRSAQEELTSEDVGKKIQDIITSELTNPLASKFEKALIPSF